MPPLFCARLLTTEPFICESRCDGTLAVQRPGTGLGVAGLVYVYDHAARDLSKRLVQEFHGHHDLALATLHVHLDDDNCMEMTALKGSADEVRHFADHIIAERGVRYGRVVMIPTAPEKSKGRKRAHGHSH